MYRDFCELAFEEVHEPGHMYWAGEMGLSTFRVAQCVRTNFECDNDAEDSDLLNGALKELMDEARPEIHHALRAQFGDDSLLFVCLWNTVEFSRYEDSQAGFDDENTNASMEQNGENDKDQERSRGQIDWLDKAADILNSDITGQKLAAHSWIQDGMPSLH